MRNLTLSLPEDLVRDAKVYAAERDLSLSALVRETLESVVTSRDRRREAVKRLLDLAKKPLYSIPPGSWNRDELHER
jgi:Arc/MetJ-type ribon-helix-helix transcriptional regulator